MPVTTVMSMKQASSSTSSPSSPSSGSRSWRLRAEKSRSMARALPLHEGETNREDLGRVCRAGEESASQSFGIIHLSCLGVVHRS